MIDPGSFREVLGQYPTGVVVVTALDEGTPLGMTVGSFTSVSLVPPLVAFMPDKSSSSWRALRAAGRSYCVNILSADQEDVCRAVAMRKRDKLHDIAWHASPAGSPIIEGSVAYLDIVVRDIFDGGDHDIVVAGVEDMAVHARTYPLLFFRGGYGSFVPHSMATADADLADQLTLVDLARPFMEQLATRFDTEVTAITLVRNELVMTAAAGKSSTKTVPTRVGQRLPFIPPLGSPFAAWGAPEVLQRWLDNCAPETSAAELAGYRDMPQRIRSRGYTIALHHPLTTSLEETKARLSGRDATVSAELRSLIRNLAASYNPEVLPDRDVHLRSVSAPVLDPDDAIAFMLTLWGPLEPVSRQVVDDHISAVLVAGSAASRAIAAHLTSAQHR